MSARYRELITTDKAAVVAKPVLDAIVVENSEGDGCFSDAPCTDESDGFKVFSKIDNLLDQFVSSETGGGRRRRRFSHRNTARTSDGGPPVFVNTDLA